MTQVGNNTGGFGGEYMVQDSDHSIASESRRATQSKVARQPEQSQTQGRQAGGDDQNDSGQHGGGGQNESGQQGGGRRRR